MTEENKLTFADWMLYKNAMLLYDKSNIFNISFDEKMATGVGKVNIIRLHDDQVQLIDNNVIVWTEFGNCKLILRSIEQLTDEEEQYIVKNFVFVSWNVFEKLTELNLTVLMGYCWFLKLKDLFDYLREKNIMNEKPDWFEIGKAVKDE